MNNKSILILSLFLIQTANSQVFELENNPNKAITININQKSTVIENNSLNPSTSNTNENNINNLNNDDLNKKNESPQEIVSVDNKNDINDEVIIPSTIVVDTWMNTIQAKKRNYEDIENLLKKGQNPNQPLFSGSTMLHVAAWQNDEKLFFLGLKYSANLSSINNNGETPLQWASYSNNSHLVSIILNDKQVLKTINKQNKNGRTALHFNALTNGNLDIAKQLIAKKADINVKDKNGQTALQYALVSKKWELAKLYIESGADLKLKDNNNQSFDDYLMQNGDDDGFQYLKQYLSSKNQELINDRMTHLSYN